MMRPQQVQLSRQWRNTDCAKVHSLMAATNRPTAEPHHELSGSMVLGDLYAGCEFYDDVSGAPLDHAMVTAARKTEIEFFKSRGVYTKVRQEPWMKIISTKWLDQNKGDHVAPNYRSRLVGCDFALE